MKTIRAILFAIAVTLCSLAQAATVILDLAYTGSPAPAKFTIWQNVNATNKVVLLDNIPGGSKAVAVTITNGAIYTLSATATIIVGTQTFTIPSNVLPPLLLVLPVIALH